GIRDFHVTGVQTCALPISIAPREANPARLAPPAGRPAAARRSTRPCPAGRRNTHHEYFLRGPPFTRQMSQPWQNGGQPHDFAGAAGNSPERTRCTCTAAAASARSYFARASSSSSSSPDLLTLCSSSECTILPVFSARYSTRATRAPGSSCSSACAYSGTWSTTSSSHASRSPPPGVDASDVL